METGWDGKTDVLFPKVMYQGENCIHFPPLEKIELSEAISAGKPTYEAEV